MSLSIASRDLLGAFPNLAPGEVAIYVMEGSRQVFRAGAEDGTSFSYADGEAQAVPGPGRSCVTQDLAAEGQLMVTFDTADETVLKPILRSLLAAVGEREQLEQDMESMYSGSLALLEESSMVGDMLPELSRGETETEIATMALQALVVAASVKRALYVDFEPEIGTCEVLVQAVMGECGRKAVLRPFEGDVVFDADTGVVGEALRKQAVVLRAVEELGLGEPGSPEHPATRDVIAVPVCSGSGDKILRLGVLVVIDKRPNSYSSRRRLGSPESKLTLVVAAMLGSVLGARKLAKLGVEMDLAIGIHEQILPAGPVGVAGFDVAGSSKTSGDVGGDYFDYLPMADGRTLAVVADVSGHNLASGMVMVSARSTLRVLARSHRSAAAIFNAADEHLLPDLTRTEQFITAAAVALRPDSHVVDVVNAGHLDTLWFHADRGEVECLPSTSTIFGFASGDRHRNLKVKMEPGDVLLLYTDGAVEAVNSEEEMFGDQRLCSVVMENAGEQAQGILDAVFATVEDFVDHHRFQDDITAVVIKALA